MKHPPATLNLNGHQLQRSGTGRTAGTHLYLDMAWSRTHELHLGQVDATGPFYSMVAITGNSALRRLKVGHTALQGSPALRVGDEMLVEVKWAADTNCPGPRPRGGWPPAHPVRSGRPKNLQPISPEPGTSAALLHENHVSSQQLTRKESEMGAL